MKISELDYSYPEELVARAPQFKTRIMMVEESAPPQEINKESLLALFQPGDVLAINTTKVLKRRVFSLSEDEILFLDSTNEQEWQVLFPAREYKVGDVILLPGEVQMTLLEKGLPQKVQTSKSLTAEYFTQFGEMPLPPYIQKARGSRHNVENEEEWYQTDWAKEAGSFAAPTASLHFDLEDLRILRDRGVQICEVILHVGLGTFLPVKVQDLNEHKMHAEFCSIPQKTLEQIDFAKKNKGNIWALGTTVTRSLESYAQGLLEVSSQGASGWTSLLIQPGYEFKIVNRLLTNFHQPKSTLLALVFAFAGDRVVRSSYAWAIEKKFSLFSYGDLSVWIKKQ